MTLARSDATALAAYSARQEAAACTVALKVDYSWSCRSCPLTCVSLSKGGVWGARKSTMPLAGAPTGTPFQEFVIAAVAYSSAPTGIISFALILWGLRLETRPPPADIQAA
ncbi:MAG: hypothetical protein JO366_04860 [Methylobacteriaceae bacterium]|nr:hypothetical protein [Methylobacteriaceae bacterium]